MTDVVTLTNLYGGIAAAERAAVVAAEFVAIVQMGRHLRREHGYSRRKIARTLGVPERWVRDNVEATDE
jgi:hypothetical protein